jgi:hypothetical protein
LSESELADCETLTKRQVGCAAKAEAFVWHAGVRYHICTRHQRMLREGNTINLRKCDKFAKRA